jgi:hypothetical protein
MSRQELADEVNNYLFAKTERVFDLDGGYVGKLERGEHRWPGDLYREGFRAVLCVDSDAELGFWIVRGFGRSANRPAVDSSVSTVAAATGQLSADGVLWTQWLTGGAQRSTSGSARRISGADVEAVGGMFDALTASDRQFGGVHARQMGVGYLRHVVWPCLHAHGSEQALRAMAVVGTEFVLRIASMDLDAGDARSCRRMLAVAGGIADAADDLSLTAWVLARRGEYEIYANRPRTAVAYTASAAAMAEHLPPAARAFIMAKHALALSLTGGGQAATCRVLGEAEDAAVRAEAGAEPRWMRVYNLGHVRHDAGRCYANLAMGERAARAAEEAIGMHGRGRFVRPRAFSLGVAAIGHAQAGEVERSCAAGLELAEATTALGSGRVRTRLAEVVQALRPYRNTPAARDFLAAAHMALRATAGTGTP